MDQFKIQTQIVNNEHHHAEEDMLMSSFTEFSHGQMPFKRNGIEDHSCALTDEVGMGSNKSSTCSKTQIKRMLPFS